MKKAALKKELREIDRQLSRFGVLIQNEPHEASGAIEVALENMGIEEAMPANKASEKIQRNAKCKHMKERLEKYGYLDNAKTFDPVNMDPLLRSKTEHYTKCQSENIYGKSIPQSPYLWPLIPVAPDDYRYISPAEFFRKTRNGTLTPDELFMFNVVHNINATTTGPRFSALILACQNGHTDIANMLLTHGADANQPTTAGMTALMFACHQGDAEIAELLLDRGADINLTNAYGNTALDLAIENGHEDIQTMLRSRL